MECNFFFFFAFWEKEISRRKKEFLCDYFITNFEPLKLKAWQDFFLFFYKMWRLYESMEFKEWRNYTIFFFLFFFYDPFDFFKRPFFPPHEIRNCTICKYTACGYVQEMYIFHLVNDFQFLLEYISIRVALDAFWTLYKALSPPPKYTRRYSHILTYFSSFFLFPPSVYVKTSFCIIHIIQRKKRQ